MKMKEAIHSYLVYCIYSWQMFFCHVYRHFFDSIYIGGMNRCIYCYPTSIPLNVIVINAYDIKLDIVGVFSWLAVNF